MASWTPRAGRSSSRRRPIPCRYGGGPGTTRLNFAARRLCRCFSLTPDGEHSREVRFYVNGKLAHARPRDLLTSPNPNYDWPAESWYFGRGEAPPVHGNHYEGLLSDLNVNRPTVIALQLRDWAPDVDDSAAFFMKTPSLSGWLRAHYVQATGPDGYDIWLRRSGTP